MPQYDIAFAEKLSQVAGLVLADGDDDIEAQRTVLYLSLLSTEIALKAMLEKAGKPVPEIRDRSHDLAALLRDLDQCSIQAETVLGQLHAVSASRIRAITLRHGGAVLTVGAVLDTELNSISRYPNEVRYGDQLRHYHPSVAAQLAAEVVTFARDHWSGLRRQVP
jgi:HEPN domain-containing protein